MASAQVAAVARHERNAEELHGFDERLVHIAQSGTPKRLESFRAYVVSPQEVHSLALHSKPSQRRIVTDEQGTLYAGVLIHGANWPLNLYSYLFCCETKKLPFGDLDRIWVARMEKKHQH